MSKRILILSDSLALPRSMPEVCAHERTWPELLKKEGYVVHQVSIGGATSADLFTQVVYHKEFHPNMVIVQVGIVDCAPRFMTKMELLLTRKIPLLGVWLIKILNNKFIKKIRNISYVKPTAFKRHIANIQSAFTVPVYFIGILNATDEYEKRLPGVTKRIVQYNKILCEQEYFIGTNSFDKQGLMSDYHHLNEDGHCQIKELILKKLDA